MEHSQGKLNISKHATPGPWISEYCGKDRIAIFKISDKRRVATITVKTPKMDEANAQLIAAAPELLEAAKSMEALVHLMCDILRKGDSPTSIIETLMMRVINSDQSIGDAQAAIAKATGKG